MLQRRNFLDLVGLLCVAALLSGGCASTQTSSTTVVSLPQAKLNLRSYIDSGRYAEELADVVQGARELLSRSIEGVDRPAIVLDIDETSLSNLDYELKTDFCFTRESWDKFVKEADAPALEPTFELYNYALEEGVAVFFVTGRRERHREATARNLRDAGYETWERLYLKADDYDLPSAATYKTASRQEIVDEGYTIVLNMGDQPSDLEGGLALHSIKLPNPFYGVP